VNLKARLGATGVRKQVEDVKEITAHPALDLILEPNKHMDGFSFEEKTHYYQQQIGNAYWARNTDGVGAVKSMGQLEPWRVTIIPDPEKVVGGYVLDKGQQHEKFFPAEDVAHFMYPNPFNPLVGMGNGDIAIWTIVRAISMRTFKQALWDNHARPDFLLRAQYGLTKAQKKRILREWFQLFRGVAKAGRAGVVDHDLDVKQLNFSPREVALIAEAKFDRDELANLYGVPVSKLTVGTHLGGGGSETDSDDGAWKADTILPLTLRFEMQLNMHFVPWFDPSQRIFFAHDNPVPKNVEQRVKVDESDLKTGARTINEVRAERNLPPVEWGERPWLPLTVAQVGTPERDKPPPPAPKSQKSDEVDFGVGVTPQEQTLEGRLESILDGTFRGTVGGNTPEPTGAGEGS
jgi:HK97 family phage portal protein